MAEKQKAKKAKPKKSSKSQAQRFMEKARELGMDEDPEAFEKAFMAVAKGTPKVAGKASQKKTERDR